jgi:hypothetical protein
MSTGLEVALAATNSSQKTVPLVKVFFCRVLSKIQWQDFDTGLS